MLRGLDEFGRICYDGRTSKNGVELVSGEPVAKYAELLRYLKQRGSAKVSDLSRDLYLSESTVRRALGADHPLLRQLYWRDFFSYVAYHHPHVFAGAFHRRYDAVRWENNRKQFKAWCEGMTGFPLVDADQISREILLPGSPLLPVLAQRFGADILYADGSLNRRLLADRAFAAPEGKAALDSFVLPEIIRRVCRLKQAAREAGAPLFVIDGAVIVGTDAEKECDHLCVVTAPFATSVARIAARDGIAPEMAARRLNAQTPEEVLLARADLVLRNDADLASLEAAAAALCEQLQAEGARKGGADTSL